MSTENGIQKIESGDRVAVIDVETGAAGEGDTYPEALEDLAERVRAITGLADTASDIRDLRETGSDTERAVASLETMRATSEFINLAEETQDRFEAEDVDEETVEAAIEWARSQ
ncbi:MAG: hypothetical protein V5A27_06415 [Halapricum sp.]